MRCLQATLMVGVVIVAAACVLALIPEAKVAGERGCGDDLCA